MLFQIFIFIVLLFFIGLIISHPEILVVIILVIYTAALGYFLWLFAGAIKIGFLKLIAV